MPCILSTTDETQRSTIFTFYRLWSTAALAAALFSACNTGGEDDVKINGNGDGDTDTDVDADGGADGGAETPDEPYTTALVLTSDSPTGFYSTISLNGHEVEKDIHSIHSDAVCRFDPVTDTPFIMLRMGADAIDVLDPDTFAIKKEYSVEAASNPYDIAVISDDRAYISRYDSTEMLIVEPMTGEKTGTVDLSKYADDDGIPEVSGMRAIDGKVYAFVQRLDRKDSWRPVGDSYLIVIDGDSGEVEDDFKVQGTNPYGAPEYSNALQQFVIAEPGSFSTLEDGGIELFDPVAQTLSGFIITEEALGGSAVKGLVLSETKGYAIVGVAGDNGSDTHVVSFNPQTGKKTGTLIQGEGWMFYDIELTPDNAELWLTDRTATNAGIRIFNTSTDAEITSRPIDVGLPPSDICFTK